MKPMPLRFTISVLALLFLGLTYQPALSQQLQVPGLVHYLYHTMNMPQPAGQQVRNLPGGGLAQMLGRLNAVRYPPVPPAGSVTWSGGDLGAPSGQGFNWFAVAGTGSTPSQWRLLPPGIVIALKHSANQANSGIVAFGQYDPVSGPQVLDGFVRRAGGDLGAPAGQGFYWYESTDTGDTDWSTVARLPAGTVVGLRHTQNLRGTPLQFVWQGSQTCRLDVPGNPPAACDPINPQVLPPPGFVRISGGDRGAPAGQGFVWYQKQ